jgi:2-dehydropantoate 2-reductase
MPARTSTDQLSIAIIGAGRIGSSFAYKLASAGHDVTAVARPGSTRLHQLERDSGIVLTTGERVTVALADHLDERHPFDLVIVTLLAHQAEAVIPALARSSARNVLLMFATPDGERWQAAIGRDRTSFGFAGVLATFDAEGRLGLKVQRVKALLGEQRWADLFTSAGMPAKVQPDMGTYLRTHAPLTLALESVTGMGMRAGRNANWSEARLGARGLKAGAQILKASGDKPAGLLGAPRLLQALFLWAAARAPFKEAVGNSDAEAGGLVDLYVAEAGNRPELHDAVQALLALRPAPLAGSPTSPRS